MMEITTLRNKQVIVLGDKQKTWPCCINCSESLLQRDSIVIDTSHREGKNTSMCRRHAKYNLIENGVKKSANHSEHTLQEI